MDYPIAPQLNALPYPWLNQSVPEHGVILKNHLMVLQTTKTLWVGPNARPYSGLGHGSSQG